MAATLVVAAKMVMTFPGNTEILDKLSEQYGWSKSVQNFSGKLKRSSLRYQEAVKLADVLGYNIIWQKRQ